MKIDIAIKSKIEELEIFTGVKFPNRYWDQTDKGWYSSVPSYSVLETRLNYLERIAQRKRINMGIITGKK